MDRASSSPVYFPEPAEIVIADLEQWLDKLEGEGKHPKIVRDLRAILAEIKADLSTS